MPSRSGASYRLALGYRGLIARPVDKSFRLASLNAGRRHAVCNPVRTSGAFVGFVCGRIHPGNIECAVGDTIAASYALFMVYNDKTLRIVINGAEIAGLQAGRFVTMHALFFAEKPLVFVVFEDFMEGYKGPRLGRKILMRLIAAGQLCFLRRQ